MALRYRPRIGRRENAIHQASAVAGILSCVLIAGCVTGTRVMTLPIPDTGAVAAPKGRIYLAPVTDARKFENPIDISGTRAHPVDDLVKPAVPKGGEAAALTAEQKQVLIGLQRSTLGTAVAGATLSDGQTVTERTRELIAQAFRRMGYAVVDDPKAATTATATVDEFWGWEWAYMSAQFGANVAATVVVKRGARFYEAHVRGSGINVGRDMKSSNWRKAFEIAFSDFITQLDAELARAETAGALAADPAAAAPAAAGKSDQRRKLEELKAMFDEGVISKEEYAKKRKEILDSM